jgi:hypothetical protein
MKLTVETIVSVFERLFVPYLLRNIETKTNSAAIIPVNGYASIASPVIKIGKSKGICSSVRYVIQNKSAKRVIKTPKPLAEDKERQIRVSYRKDGKYAKVSA